MASNRERVVSLVEELKRYGNHLDPNKLPDLLDFRCNSELGSMNFDLIDNLIDECRRGDFFHKPAELNLRPLEDILFELRMEFNKNYGEKVRSAGALTDCEVYYDDEEEENVNQHLLVW